MNEREKEIWVVVVVGGFEGGRNIIMARSSGMVRYHPVASINDPRGRTQKCIRTTGYGVTVRWTFPLRSTLLGFFISIFDLT